MCNTTKYTCTKVYFLHLSQLLLEIFSGMQLYLVDCCIASLSDSEEEKLYVGLKKTKLTFKTTNKVAYRYRSKFWLTLLTGWHDTWLLTFGYSNIYISTDLQIPLWNGRSERLNKYVFSSFLNGLKCCRSPIYNILHSIWKHNYVNYC